MRRALLALATLSLALWAAPALAQSDGETSSSNSSGGGTAVSGNNRSSVSIHTSGGSSVGVAQGSVSGGSHASSGDGDEGGSAASGAAAGGQAVGAVAPANAVEDGVVSQINLPGLNLGESQTAADRRPDVLTWAIAALIVVGLVVLYRRLPRSTPAA
jgi:hypothetical protein